MLEKADRMVKEAEEARARVYDVTGKELLIESIDNGLTQIRAECSQPKNGEHQEGNCCGVDNDYLLVASHLDKNMRTRILNYEYVDFAKLLRKDWFGPGTKDEQRRMIMVNKGGMTFWVPAIDKSYAINNYACWDQAFRVYLDVFTGRYPERTNELIQYGHIIQTASLSYAWENVYQYDREFRCHMERHPFRSWGIILQQAWTMFLKDRLNATPHKSGNFGGQNNHNENRVNKKLCIPFNQGTCSYGAKCRFDHRCGFCGKYGHGTFNCRKAAQIKAKDKKGQHQSVTSPPPAAN